MAKGVKWYKSSYVADYRRDNALDCVHGEDLYTKGWIRHKELLKFRYRYDPVPLTGIIRTSYSRYLKRPKTTQEKRVACGHMAEGIYIRGKRRKTSLPNYWDDKKIYDVDCKNWKHQSRKRKQWMT